MKTKNIAKLLNIGESTVRLYARTFDDFLDAQSGAGRRARMYTDRDVRIIRYISEQKDAGASDDDIRASLKTMNDNELPEVPNGAAYIEDEQKRQRLAVEVATLRTRVATLEGELEEERERRQEVETQLQETRLELARKEGQLMERPPIPFWLWVVVGVIIVAAMVVLYIGLQT